MQTIRIREPELLDLKAFQHAMQNSKVLHYPWIHAPATKEEYLNYLTRYRLPNHKSFLVCLQSGEIAGVFNISEIVRGDFQSAYLGFYAFLDYAGKGYMTQGLKLVLEKVFSELELHRLEANIQPKNKKSIQLVKRCSFRKEGLSPHYLKIEGEWRDHERWAITLEDWEKI
ncbi:MAG: GNAT family protein [Gammaproteobacteria bacterium]